MAARYDFTIDQGAQRLLTFAPKDSAGDPVDLTGAAARMQMRPTVNSSDLLLDLSTSGTPTQLAIVGNTVELTLPGSVTAGITKSGVYDIEVIYSDGSIDRMVEGSIDLSPEVTR